MTRIGTMLAVAAALAIGAMLGGGGLVQARLATGGEAIGATPDIAASEATRAGDPRALGQCVTNRTAFRTQTNFVTTTSTNFAVMPNTHFPVTHNAGCLIVDFASEVGAVAVTERMEIVAWIQGIGAAEPSFVRLDIAPGILQNLSKRFVIPNVPAGTHTVRIDWRSTNGGQLIADHRTLTVQYR